LKRRESHQLRFAFADSPQGSKDEAPNGVSSGKSILQQIAKARKVKDSNATSDPLEGLMEKIASPQNLASALLQVARNQGAPGVDGVSTEEVLEAGPRLLNQLGKDLISGSYQPGEIRRVEIQKPGGGSRHLGIPNVVDRWVQQAAHQVLGPVFEPKFHPSSHGFRPGRGAQTAIPEAKEHLLGGCSWVVGIDLSKFFDRVNHQRLLARLAQEVPDKRVLRLIHQMLKAKVVLPNGLRVNTEEGTPQGGPLSPLLSNIVLDELDWELQRRGLKFVRYADDFNVYVRSQRAGLRVMASLTTFIEKRLRLKINADKSEVSLPESVHLLGFSLIKMDVDRVEVRLSARTLKRFSDRIRELTPRRWGGSLKACLDKVNEYLKGWIGYFKLSTQCHDLDAHIRRRIRALIVKQKKKPQFLFRHLVQCGVTKTMAAKTALSSCGPWKKSNLPGMQQAYRNIWFTGRLLNLRDEWIRLNRPILVVATQLTLGL
jgi:group II intron reverse transcriptase/maturase